MRFRSGLVLAALALVACSARAFASGTWTALSIPFRTESIAVDAGAHPALWDAGGKGLARSADDGRTWTDVSTGCPSASLQFVATATGAPGTVYLADSNCGLRRSVNGGDAWQTLANPIRAGYVFRHLLIDPRDSSTVYLSWYDYGNDDTGTFKSIDGGTSWKTLALDPAAGCSLGSLGVDPSAHDTLYVGTWAGGIWKSVDAGETWRLLPGPGGASNYVSKVSVDARQGSVYAATLDGLFRSDDAGESWTVAGPGGPNLLTDLVLDGSTNPVTIYVGTRNGVLRSRDSGRTWEPLNDGLTGPIDTLVLSKGPAPVLFALSAGAIYSLALDPVPVSWNVPSVARAPGAHGAFYTTDLAIANPGAMDAALTIQFLGHDADGTNSPTTTLGLASGRAVTYADVLGSLFGVEQGYGALRITSNAAALRMTAFTTTSSADGRGRVGQAVPAFDASRLATPASPAVLVGLRDDATARTNLALANASAFPVDVELTLTGADGTVFGSTTRSLPPLGMTQVGSVVSALGGTAAVDAYLVVRVATTGGAVAAYASVVDNATNDPRTVLP